MRLIADEEAAEYEVVAHEETATAAEDGRAAGIEPRRVAKTLLLCDSDHLRAAVIPASERLDLHKARAALHGSEHLRLATEEEMGRAFEMFEPGALPPFGLGVPEVVDQRLLGEDTVLCSAGEHGHGLIMRPTEIVRLGHALVTDVCEAG